ncbi:hypothetical protein EIP91_003070, partial [Steccherinum ochraceum]
MAPSSDLKHRCGILDGTPEGIMKDGAYLHEGSDKSRAVFLFTDIFGLGLVNSKLMADRFSKELDCDVWVPDLFAGRPPFDVMELGPLLPDRAGAKRGVMTVLRLVFLFLRRLHLRFASRPSVVDERIQAFIFKTQVARKYQKIGAVGYTLGGAAAVRLGATEFINSIVVATPARTDMPEYESIRIPTLFICAEDDRSFNASYRDEVEAVFAARKDKPSFVDYG